MRLGLIEPLGILIFATLEWLTIQREVLPYLEDYCSKQWARVTALT